MEHIPKERLHVYFKNIYSHLEDHGIFIGTFTITKSNKIPHHVTIMSIKGWHKYIKKLKLFKIVNLKWNRKEYLRYPKTNRYNKTNNIPISMRKICRN